MKRCIVLNFALWRVIGGTHAFALAAGFLCTWNDEQRESIREKIKQAHACGRITGYFTTAYQSVAKICNQLGPKASPERVEAVLYNTGPGSGKKSTAVAFFSVEGKLQILDQVWEVSPKVVDAAAPDPQTGKTRWQPVCNELARVMTFGSDEKGTRKPTFLSKEVAQDLIDTPVFAGGRKNVSDLRTFSPAGPGALNGLKLLYEWTKVPTQSEAIPMMRALLALVEGPDGWDHADTGDLELHDIQFMLCEIKKFLSESPHLLRNYTGRVDADLDIDERIFYADWLRMLEDALFLGVAYIDADVSDDAAIRGVTSWLRLPTMDAKDNDGLSHGDLVFLQGAASKAFLTLDLDNASAKSLSVSQKAGTSFLIEKCDTRGPVHFGETIFLRCPKGRHIGKGDGGRVCPSQGFERYEKSQRFALEPTSGHIDGIVPGRAVVRLKHAGTTDLNEYVYLTSKGPWIGDAASSSSGNFAGEFIVEKAPCIKDRAAKVHEAFSAAIKTGLAKGDLKRDPNTGRLLLPEPEAIRRRLIGAAIPCV